VCLCVFSVRISVVNFRKGTSIDIFFCAGFSEGSGDIFSWKIRKLGFCFPHGANAGDVIGKESNDFA